jgi:hypothetical protein
MYEGFARDLSAGRIAPGAPHRKLSNRQSSLSLADGASRSQGAGGQPAPGAHSASKPSRIAASAADLNPRVGLIEQSTRAHGLAVGSSSTRPAGPVPAVLTQGEAI